MKIAIIGTGNVGSTLAADLSHKGHDVTLIKSSKNYESPCFDGIKKKGGMKVLDPYMGDYYSEIKCLDSDDDKTILAEAEVIIVTVQTTFHENVIKDISRYVKDGQALILEPGYLSTCYCIKYCNDKDLTIIEAESSPIDCRIDGNCDSHVLFKNVLNPFGVYPRKKKAFADSILELLGYPYRFTESVFEAALHNPNLIVHTVGALFSIPRVEYTKGEYWMYKEVFTPHVWNVCEELDEERMNVLSAVGVKHRQSYVEACKERNFSNDNRAPIDCFFDYAKNSSPKGPSVPDSRYLTEDVSQGLVLLESLGRHFNVATPTCSSLITLAGKALKRDFRKEGRNVERLGDAAISTIYEDGLW